jgi:hypothetical protein
MAFAQVTYRESLRDIEACLGAQPSFIPSFFEIKESARREFLSKRIGGAFFEA